MTVQFQKCLSWLSVIEDSDYLGILSKRGEQVRVVRGSCDSVSMLKTKSEIQAIPARRRSGGEGFMECWFEVGLELAAQDMLGSDLLVEGSARLPESNFSEGS